jgi:hypothetical protein
LPPELVAMGHRLFPGQSPAAPPPTGGSLPQPAPSLPPPTGDPAPAPTGGQPPPQGQQEFPWLRRLMPQQPTGFPGRSPGGPTGSRESIF